MSRAKIFYQRGDPEHERHDDQKPDRTHTPRHSRHHVHHALHEQLLSAFGLSVVAILKFLAFGEVSSATIAHHAADIALEQSSRGNTRCKSEVRVVSEISAHPDSAPTASPRS